MDNLALNIFVPEDRKKPKAKLQKTPKLPTQTVVKPSAKPGKIQRKSLAKTSKPPEKPQKRPLDNTIKKSSGKSSETPIEEGKNAVKPRVLPRAKIGKFPNAGAGTPFLISQKFGKSPTPKAQPQNDEGFSVSFVKPKLFQRKLKASKVASSEQKPTIKKAVNGSAKTVNLGNEEFDNLNFPKTKNLDSQNDSSTAAPKIVDFAGPQKPLRNKEKQKPARGDVFVAQTFSKWSVNPEAASEKVHVDFSSAGAKKIAVSTGGKQELKRRIEHGGELDVKRKKKNEVEEGENLGGKNGAGTRAEHDGTGRNRWGKFESASNKIKETGPISSLFNSDPVVEKLEEADFLPLEERVFSSKPFATVGVHPHLVGNLEQLFGITKMTVVQKKTIPVLMTGKDGLVRSQTGSGKTLAYAIPIMHCLAEVKPQLTRKDGVKALVVLPTRELALQTYECFTKLMRAFTWIVPGIVVGGEKRKSEKNRLRKGITVLIGTPGRLLDHAEHTDNLSLHGIDWLIIDEADKLLEMGYEKDISSLMAIIDGQREKSDWVGRKQTVLLSATLTSGVERLANLALKDPVRIDACGDAVLEDVLVIPNTLQQKYVVVPAKMRLVALASLLIDVAERKNSNKILVFMATQDMVDFYLELLQGVLSSTVKFYKLHGNMSQTDRTEVFNRFRSSDKGVLLSTDVAARGLDLPKVDWIVQFTAPTTPSEYVHRVGRTARVGTMGSAVLFLLPSELHFVSMLNSSRIKLGESSMDQYLKSLMKIHLESKDGQRWGGGVEGAATVLQHNFEHSILEDSALHELACKAYKSWVRFYATYPKDLRVVFDFKSLHLGHNAKSFALRDPPRAIGGIGKPKKAEKQPQTRGKFRKSDRSKRRSEGLGHVTSGSRTKKLILSEFDSGLKRTKKS